MHSRYQRDLFTARAPFRPYCSNDLAQGVHRRSLATALDHRYIQHNPPAALAFMIYDYDRPGVMNACQDAGLPEPSWVAESPDTKRGHIAYALSAPVITSEAGRGHPLRYAAAIEQGYKDALRADLRYGGFITKTPGHKDWTTHYGRIETYDLGELADFLRGGLPKLRKKREEASGLGRNVALFEGVRHWSYRARLRFDAFDPWHAAALEYSHQANAGFTTPLPLSEVKATAKSVAKWTWSRFSVEGFSAVQSARGKRGGIKSGAKKASARMDTLQRVLELNQ